MFEHLKEINPLLNQRISTMYKNIKAGSTSYYDSLGDFIDNYLKAIASKEGFEIDMNMSSGKILTDTSIKPFLRDKVGIDMKSDYDKLRKIVRFVNEHKHDNEKSLTSPNDIINTLEPVFNIYYKVTKYYNSNALDEFDKQFVLDNYKAYEKEYKTLNYQIDQLRNELTFEKELSVIQKNKINEIENKSHDYIDDEVLKELAETLIDLKDVKIELLIKKVDAITDLLIEQKASIRENRIISFATLSSIGGKSGSLFDKHIQNAVEVIEQIGFENHIDKNRKIVEEEQKQKALNVTIAKKVLDYLNNHVIEVQKSEISNIVIKEEYSTVLLNVELLLKVVKQKLINLFGEFDYSITTDQTKATALSGFPLIDKDNQASLQFSSRDLAIHQANLRFKLL